MDKQREAFEAWFASTHMPETVAVYSYGNRVDANIKSNCWLAWQACAKQYEAEIERLKTALSEAMEWNWLDGDVPERILSEYREQSK